MVWGISLSEIVVAPVLTHCHTLSMNIEQILGLKKFESYLVEDCWKLRMSDLDELPGIIDSGVCKVSDRMVILKSGRHTIRFNGLSYALISIDPTRLSLELSLGDGKSTKQEVVLTKVKANYGLRWSFVCGCQKKVNCLYFRPDVQKWACRECLYLVYELTRIKRDSLLGELEYRLNRWMKLEKVQGDVKTLFYDGKPTRNLKRLVRLRQKWLGPDTVPKIQSLQAKSLNI